MIPPRLSFVTLGVREFDTMRAFYEGFGWPTKFVDTNFVSFQIGSVILALYPIEKLAEEAGAEPPVQGTWSGWTLAYNVGSRDEVDGAWQAWVDHGATPVNRPVDHPYGPRSGYVADPEGNRWEIAYADGVEVEVKPSRDEFRALAHDHIVVPVWREVLGDLTTPVSAFLRVVGDRPGFLLESVDHERWGRWSFVGRDPLATIVARGRELEVHGTLPAPVPTDQGALAAIEALCAELRSPTLPDLPPLHGGVVGYLGYDVVREVERLPHVPPDDLGNPDAVLSVIGEIAAYDHWRQRVMLVANAFVPTGADIDAVDAAYDDACGARVDALAAAGSSALAEPLVEPPDPDDPLPDVVSSMGGGDYHRAIDVAREHILDGDIFQVVLAQRFAFDLQADPFDVYRVLRQINPSPYMYFVRSPQVTLVGSSPEPMVLVRDGQVISRPIAGTRYRGRTDEEDRRLGAELVEHPKEIAEHVMLLDLARNDVGRVVRFGTERVTERMTLERYSHVMHMTSQVVGELREGLGPVDVLRATLPAGTVSGAPKVRAMQIIDDLEPVKRGPYAGVVGYVDFSGTVDTAIAIRTMVCQPDGRASVSAGAGIVADSVPEHEDLECRNKARALLSAVPAARRMTAARLAEQART